MNISAAKVIGDLITADPDHNLSSFSSAASLGIKPMFSYLSAVCILFATHSKPNPDFLCSSNMPNSKIHFPDSLAAKDDHGR